MIVWENIEKISALIAVVIAVISALRYFFTREPASRVAGAGGNAEVVGAGEARGGDGGSVGQFGEGGRGGDAKVVGGGKAVGGSGGDG